MPRTHLRSLAASSAAFLALALPGIGQSTSPFLPATRWVNYGRYPNLEDLGVPKSVALGDDGALAVVGRTWTRPGVDFHASGSETPVRSIRFADRNYYLGVAAADHAPVAAVITLNDVDPDPTSIVFESRIRYYDAADDVEERWTWAFPTEKKHYSRGAGVAVSDDGQVILGWQISFDIYGYRMVALSPDGRILSRFDLPALGTGLDANHRVQLSDDGSRAIVPQDNTAVLVDVLNGSVIDMHATPKGTPITGITLSGDGTRYAVATWKELSVREADGAGTWQDLLVLPQVGDEWYGPLDLSQDGSRLAYTIQHILPADSFELVLIEPETGAELTRVIQSAPGTYKDLCAFDVDLGDDGRTIACASFGDAFNKTPEAFVVDDAGQLLSEYRLRGSAVDVDLDARGEVLLIGAEGGYGFHYVGGTVVAADVRAPQLRLAGRPYADEPIELTLAGDAAHTHGVIWAGLALGTTRTPWGESTVDLGAGATRVGVWALTDGAARDVLPLEAPLGLAGELLHFQGATFGGGTGQLTNKVSVRVRS